MNATVLGLHACPCSGADAAGELRFAVHPFTDYLQGVHAVKREYFLSWFEAAAEVRHVIVDHGGPASAGFEAALVQALEHIELVADIEDCQAVLVCRRHGFSEASYYLWGSKFGGMSVSDAKRLKELETETPA